MGVGGCLPIGTNIGSKVQGQRGVCVWLYVDRHLGSKGVGVGGGGRRMRGMCAGSQLAYSGSVLAFAGRDGFVLVVSVCKLALVTAKQNLHKHACVSVCEILLLW